MSILNVMSLSVSKGRVFGCAHFLCTRIAPLGETRPEGIPLDVTTTRAVPLGCVQVVHENSPSGEFQPHSIHAIEMCVND